MLHVFCSMYYDLYLDKTEKELACNKNKYENPIEMTLTAIRMSVSLFFYSIFLLLLFDKIIASLDFTRLCMDYSIVDFSTDLCARG